ncbi:Retrotransposon-derived protein peg10 [Entomophthora muscae]|uniref:Retrotransposon-derived protein peg10 n=1 Tax=Entomophthora muscae TaxID=34485 RepID=A0ACC2RI73_9FUNG|nr:Retrotransposon-derived protein peg10 [Entomophthora muscae]
MELESFDSHMYQFAAGEYPNIDILLEGHTPTSYTNQTLMHSLTLLLIDLSSPPTPRRSSILQRSSLVTKEIGLALTQYATQVSHKVCSHLANTTGSFALFSQDYKPLTLRLLQEFLVHHNFPDKLEPLIREVVKWNQKYLSLKTHPSSNLSPAAWLFVPDKVPLSSTPPPGTEPKSGGGFCLTAKEVLRRRNNNLCSYCGSKDHLLPACPLSKCSPFVNKTSTLTLLSLIDTSKSPTILVTIHGPLGKIKVLDLLNTGANANFIESLDVKVGNSTITGVTPILQPVTIDLESSPFCVTCNFSPNLFFLFILGFLWLRESFLNFDHPNNKISFTCNDYSLPNSLQTETDYHL